LGRLSTALYNIIWKKEMNVAFLCEGMTDLRYLLPLYLCLSRNRGEIDFYLYYTSSGKYNSVDLNFKRFLSILESDDFSNIKIFHAENIDSSVFFDILFTIENISDFNIRPGKENKKSINASFNYRKRYCIQHGLDYLNFASSDKEYIVTSSCYSDDLMSRFSCSSVTSEIPISFWDIENQLSLINKEIKDRFSKKSVCIFYPEAGYHNEVLEIINFLIERKYSIIIKQRRKNQGLPKEYFNHRDISICFDDLWYPSESIISPAITGFTIGFGTSAYTELVPAGIKYIDVAIPDYSKPIENYNGDTSIPIDRRGYVKPTSDIFLCITENYVESCFEAIEEFESKENNTRFEKFKDYSDKFLIGLLKL